jgi:hypothetical protein
VFFLLGMMVRTCTGAEGKEKKRFFFRGWNIGRILAKVLLIENKFSGRTNL